MLWYELTVSSCVVCKRSGEYFDKTLYKSLVRKAINPEMKNKMKVHIGVDAGQRICLETSISKVLPLHQKFASDSSNLKSCSQLKLQRIICYRRPWK